MDKNKVIQNVYETGYKEGVASCNLEELAVFLEDFDELTGKQAAWLVRNFNSSTECYHLHVKIYTRCVARENYLEPAEYEQHAHCKDCGEWLDVEDVPSVAEREDA